MMLIFKKKKQQDARSAAASAACFAPLLALTRATLPMPVAAPWCPHKAAWANPTEELPGYYHGRPRPRLGARSPRLYRVCQASPEPAPPALTSIPLGHILAGPHTGSLDVLLAGPPSQPIAGVGEKLRLEES